VLHTLFIGQKHIHVQDVDSTNNYAAALVRQGHAIEGLIVTASSQSHGKGQRGNSWISSKDESLLLSCVLFPHFLNITHQYVLNKAIAIATCNTINSFLKLPIAQIKWPNDIFCEDRKMAGILLENTIQGSHIGSTVAGIGINILQKSFTIPNVRATSLLLETNLEFSQNEVSQALCTNIEPVYLMLKAKRFAEIDQLYHERLKGINQGVTIIHNKIAFDAILKGVNIDGNLIIETNKGMQVFPHGSIQVQFHIK